MDKNTGQRVQLPILSETGTFNMVHIHIITRVVLDNGSWYRFESNLTPVEHATFNKELNKMIGPDRRWLYKHTKTVDSILNKTATQAKSRVTQDETKTRVLESMVKKRLGDLAIFMPNYPLDVRISVNLEMPSTVSPADLQAIASGNIDSERFKDRRSYQDTITALQYDLTEVTQRKSGTIETRYELEMEAINAADLLKDPSNFINEIRGFSGILRRK